MKKESGGRREEGIGRRRIGSQDVLHAYTPPLKEVGSYTGACTGRQ